MFVFIPGSIPPVRFGPGGTDPAEISIPAVTYIHIQLLLILYESPLFAMLHVLYHFVAVKNAQFFVKKVSFC